MKYILDCPKCKSEHDVTKQMNIWKEELFKKISKLVDKEIRMEEDK